MGRQIYRKGKIEEKRNRQIGKRQRQMKTDKQIDRQIKIYRMRERESEKEAERRADKQRH